MTKNDTERLSEQHQAELIALKAAKEAHEAAETEALATLEKTDEYAAHASAASAALNAREALQIFVAYLCNIYHIDRRTDAITLAGDIHRGEAPSDETVAMPHQSRARRERALAMARARNQS